MRTWFLLGLGLVLAVGLGFAPMVMALEEPDLSGAYQCVGDAGTGKQYQGTAQITKEGDCYGVKWAIIGGQHFTGLGIREGATLAVAIRDEGDPKYAGIIVYRVEKGGKLTGRFSAFGYKGTMYAETLTPEKPGPPGTKEPPANRPADKKADDKAVAEELKKLQGTWLIVAGSTFNGKDLREDQGAGGKIVIQGNKYEILNKQGKPANVPNGPDGTLSVNPAKNPRQIDLTFKYAGKDNVVEGIFELDGDNLKICHDIASTDRPEKFRTADGSFHRLFVLQREKKPAAAESEIVGNFKCVGDAGNGKSYEAKVQISKEGDCYLLKWQTAANQGYTGLGIREGDILAACIRDDKDEKYTGIIVYRIEKGPKLVGRWSAFGSRGETLTETLTSEK